MFASRMILVHLTRSECTISPHALGRGADRFNSALASAALEDGSITSLVPRGRKRHQQPLPERWDIAPVRRGAREKSADCGPENARHHRVGASSLVGT